MLTVVVLTLQLNALKRFVDMEDGMVTTMRPAMHEDPNAMIWGSAAAWQMMNNPAAAFGGMYPGYWPAHLGADGTQQQQQQPGDGSIKPEDAGGGGGHGMHYPGLPFQFGMPGGEGMDPGGGMELQAMLAAAAAGAEAAPMPGMPPHVAPGEGDAAPSLEAAYAASMQMYANWYATYCQQLLKGQEAGEERGPPQEAAPAGPAPAGGGQVDGSQAAGAGVTQGAQMAQLQQLQELSAAFAAVQQPQPPE
jgi:hypothetical protein